MMKIWDTQVLGFYHERIEISTRKIRHMATRSEKAGSQTTVHDHLVGDKRLSRLLEA